MFAICFVRLSCETYDHLPCSLVVYWCNKLPQLYFIGCSSDWPFSPAGWLSIGYWSKLVVVIKKGICQFGCILGYMLQIVWAGVVCGYIHLNFTSDNISSCLHWQMYCLYPYLSVSSTASLIVNLSFCVLSALAICRSASLIDNRGMVVDGSQV